MTRQRTSISLFSGIAGLDSGLHKAGFEPIFCAEIDPNAQATLKLWLSKQGIESVVASDVTQINPHDLRRDLGLVPGELDLLAGGSPCQSFSLIGRHGSLLDERGLLLFQMVRYAKAFMPKVVLIEQVKGLKSAQCLKKKKGGVLENLVQSFQELGYTVSYDVLRAADFGVPQIRDRLFLVASLEGKFFFPQPTHFPASSVEEMPCTFGHQLLNPYETVYDAIHDLPEPMLKGERENISNHIDVTPNRDRERINGVPEGECLARQLHLPLEQRQRLNPQKDTTKFRRLAWHKPSLTLRGGEVFYHPSENRYLTPRECLRLHSFSDAYVLVGPIRGRTGSVKTLDQHRLVANAVPPLLAEVLGKSIVSQFFSEHHHIDVKHVLQPDYCCQISP
jgi:DNA (cytosine-5)-methyltransferase 1